jgi:predicted ABC-type ATPase
VLDHIERGASFAVETTLRTGAAIEQAHLARQRGFATEMRFIATDVVAWSAMMVPWKTLVVRDLQRCKRGA